MKTPAVPTLVGLALAWIACCAALEAQTPLVLCPWAPAPELAASAAAAELEIVEGPVNGHVVIRISNGDGDEGAEYLYDAVPIGKVSDFRDVPQLLADGSLCLAKDGQIQFGSKRYAVSGRLRQFGGLDAEHAYWVVEPQPEQTAAAAAANRRGGQNGHGDNGFEDESGHERYDEDGYGEDGNGEDGNGAGDFSEGGNGQDGFEAESGDEGGDRPLQLWVNGALVADNLPESLTFGQPRCWIARDGAHTLLWILSAKGATLSIDGKIIGDFNGAGWFRSENAGPLTLWTVDGSVSEGTGNISFLDGAGKKKEGPYKLERNWDADGGKIALFVYRRGQDIFLRANNRAWRCEGAPRFLAWDRATNSPLFMVDNGDSVQLRLGDTVLAAHEGLAVGLSTDGPFARTEYAYDNVMERVNWRYPSPDGKTVRLHWPTRDEQWDELVGRLYTDERSSLLAAYVGTLTDENYHVCRRGGEFWVSDRQKCVGPFDPATGDAGQELRDHMPLELKAIAFALNRQMEFANQIQKHGNNGYYELWVKIGLKYWGPFESLDEFLGYADGDPARPVFTAVRDKRKLMVAGEWTSAGFDVKPIPTFGGVSAAWRQFAFAGPQGIMVGSYDKQIELSPGAEPTGAARLADGTIVVEFARDGRTWCRIGQGGDIGPLADGSHPELYGGQFSQVETLTVTLKAGARLPKGAKSLGPLGLSDIPDAALANTDTRIAWVAGGWYALGPGIQDLQCLSVRAGERWLMFYRQDETEDAPKPFYLRGGKIESPPEYRVAAYVGNAAAPALRVTDSFSVKCAGGNAMMLQFADGGIGLFPGLTLLDKGTEPERRVDWSIQTLPGASTIQLGAKVLGPYRGLWRASPSQSDYQYIAWDGTRLWAIPPLEGKW